MPGTYQYDVEIKSNVAKLLKDMKQIQDRLDTVEGREYKIKLNVDEKKLSNVISNLEKMLDSLGKGTGDFKQFENLSKELSSIVSEVQSLSKAFGKVAFNLSINAAASGGALLQQAWFDVQLKKQFAVRVGKFKTPFSHAYLTTLGETLLPQLPVSLTSAVILPYSLNAVTPNIGTGFDLGVEIHGLVADKFGYEVGLFNGTGSSVNTATKTLSDDWHIPSLLYAGRFTYMPKGVMPSTQGNPNRLNEDKIMFGVSASINVESENESTNDTRVGVEFAMLKNKLYLGAEAYYMNVGFTDRQKINESYNYLGGYVQGGYFIAPRLQAALRYDFFNRNGTGDDGFLNMPAVGMNYFFKGCNLKLQAMYQYIARTGHDTQLDRDNDNLGLATHSATVMLQYTF